MLADPRLENIAGMRDAGIEAPFLLLRLPALSEASPTVRLCDLSLAGEVATVHALSAAAQAENVTRQVILMVEGGDRREGIMPEDTVAACRDILASPNIELAGVGTVLNCLRGVPPTPENQQAFARVVEPVEAELGMRFRLVSAGHRRARRDRSEDGEPDAHATRRDRGGGELRSPRARRHRGRPHRPPGEKLSFDTLHPAVSTGWASSCTTKVVHPLAR